jgi:prevent-host-death family protein
MASIVNMLEAKTTLSKLVERAEAGEEIVIARDGIPAVRLVPVPVVPASQRLSGPLRGKIWMSDDFDAPLSEEDLALFYDAPIEPVDRIDRQPAESPPGRAPVRRTR